MVNAYLIAFGGLLLAGLLGDLAGRTHIFLVDLGAFTGAYRIWQQLVDLGIEPRSARFYPTPLEMPEPTVADVAKASNISRTSACDIVASLTQRGLVDLADSTPVQQRVGTKVPRPHRLGGVRLPARGAARGALGPRRR